MRAGCLEWLSWVMKWLLLRLKLIVTITLCKQCLGNGHIFSLELVARKGSVLCTSCFPLIRNSIWGIKGAYFLPYKKYHQPQAWFSCADQNIENLVTHNVLSFIALVDVRYIKESLQVVIVEIYVHYSHNYELFFLQVPIHIAYIRSFLTSCSLQCQPSFFLDHLQDQKMCTHSLMQQWPRLQDGILILFFSSYLQIQTYWHCLHCNLNLQENSLVSSLVRKLLLNYITRPRIPLNNASYSIFSEVNQPGVLQRVGSVAGMVLSLELTGWKFCLYAIEYEYTFSTIWLTLCIWCCSNFCVIAI